MLKSVHWKLAGFMLPDIQGHCDWKIARIPFLIGSIAPDINFVYPKHTWQETNVRFVKRMVRITNIKSVVYKSFMLGVLSHYICDYFCYAHNIKQVDPKHMIYERLMRKHLKLHMNQISRYDEDVSEEWIRIRDLIHDEIENREFREEILYSSEASRNSLKNISEQSVEDILKIVDSVYRVHEEYLAETNKFWDEAWFRSHNKISLDLTYARKVCEEILPLLAQYEQI